MATKHSLFWRGILVLTVFVLLASRFSTAYGEGKVGLYGIRMVPYGTEGEKHSRPGWGGGLNVVAPVPQLGNMLAGTLGFEITNLLSRTVAFQDGLTGLRVYQQSDQNYYRLYLGPQVGGHGNGFVRPHAGLNLALVFYNFKTDVVVPDDDNRELEIRQNLKSETKAVFGYDLSLGMDLNFANKVAVEGGMRYLKSFSVPQQLGEGSVKIHPQYFQIYLGVGASFRVFRR
ncbi:MAG: outer membrane beta-barrel protein [candidate division Zixibacteria bacterium]|nr:outer membrane beta-barrel protein [candidate division Zixibacteria bacterium]